jgi:hypothetical protein
MSGRLKLALRSILLAAVVGVAAPEVLLAEARAIEAERLLDGFDDLSGWKAAGSEGVQAALEGAKGPEGHALKLKFDLAGTAGYALAHRRLPLDLPDNFELSFYVRGDAKPNAFQVKLLDASGDNVWWFSRPDFEFSSEWRRVTIKKRQIAFAWGPIEDRTLRRTESIEFVVSAGRGGGSGSIEIADLTLRELPPPPARLPPLVATASSSQNGFDAAQAVDGNKATAWRSDPAMGPAQSLTLDFGVEREFGGLVLDWREGARPRRYDVMASEDGASWRLLRSVSGAEASQDALRLPDEEARFIRLNIEAGPEGCALAEIEVKDLSFGASPNAFFEALAKTAPRGYYPRGFSGEQTYWTLVGIDGGGAHSGLLSEDGAFEIGTGGFSIEPFVVEGSRLFTWADVKTTQSLAEGYLPIPTATWEAPDWSLRITAFAQGTRDASELVGSYSIINRTDAPQSLRLALVARPFQVNPPTQFLNTAGGVSRIAALDWDGTRLSVDGKAKLLPLAKPQRFEAAAFQDGSYPARLLEPGNSTRAQVTDDEGFASGALVYDIELAPNESRTIGIIAPLTGEARQPELGGRSPKDWLDAREEEAKASWRARLNLVAFDVPPADGRLIDALRSSLAHILMSRDGPVLRPGTRAYARSWIRDGAMISEGLARLGHADIAADYLRWFAPYQFKDGRVPCCIDARGADPVPENDSDGELIFLAAEVFRYTGDRALLAAMWPHVQAAVQHMDALRASERTSGNQRPSRRMLYGLLPPSISHEGYASKPAYSYWDDFWGLAGYKSAVAIAEALGESGAAAKFAKDRDQFRDDILASIRAAAKVHGIAHVPGAADLGDFDATSTTIALAPADEEHGLPSDLLRATFERYWKNFAERRDGRASWTDYTPYELRLVGTFLRLAQPDRARELLDYFMKDQRPAGWNQWAEVVGRAPREPRFIGDMPHAWIASDYVRSVLDMFAYDRPGDGTLVLAAGVPEAWCQGTGFAVRNLRTPYGRVSLSCKLEDRGAVFRVDGDAKPPGGFLLRSPWPHPVDAHLANGQSLTWKNGELPIGQLPAEIVVKPSPPPPDARG